MYMLTWSNHYTLGPSVAKTLPPAQSLWTRSSKCFALSLSHNGLRLTGCSQKWMVSLYRLIETSNQCSWNTFYRVGPSTTY